MRDNNNADKEKSQEEFHSLVNLDSKDWKVEASEDNQQPEESNIIYEKEEYIEKDFNPAKSTAKYKWIVLILISVIILAGIFFLVKWYKISSQPNDLSLSGETVYFGSDVNDENDEELVSNSTNDVKQEMTTSKISSLMSVIIGQDDEKVNKSEDVTEDDVTELATEEVTELGEEVTEEKTEKTTKEDGKKPTQSASKKPSTTAEVVEYFNKAVNSVKTGAKSVKQHSIVNYLASPIKIGDGLKGIYNMLGGDDWLDKTLQSNSTGEATYIGADIKKNYPVETESWASKLTADDVKSATCTEANGVYTIKIVTKDDAKTTSVKHGQGHNPKVFSVVLPATINDNIPGIAKGITGEVAMNYPSGTATITVDVATGHVLTAVYDAHWTINFDMMATSIPFATKTTYSICW